MVKRNAVVVQSIFFSAAAILVFTTTALFLFVGVRGVQFFFLPGGSLAEFFLGTSWDQNSNTYGVLPLLYGSVVSVILTLLISAPLAIAVAVFMVEIAPAPVRRVMRTTVELFASLPSVIYGLLGLIIVVPWVREALGAGLGKGILAASIVLVFMTQPTIVSIAEDALRALPESLREGALATGATRWQMIWRVLLPAARSGLITAVILGTGRAIGETMAVQMVVGNITARVPNSLVTGATTMPSAIVTQLPEATNAEHRAALIMVAFLLLMIALVLIIGVRMVSGGGSGGRSRRASRVAATGVKGERATAAASIEGNQA
ncbi:MAG: phosphate ABC transporter permease subunit PstC [Roseiflexaceae bacterium]